MKKKKAQLILHLWLSRSPLMILFLNKSLFFAYKNHLWGKDYISDADYSEEGRVFTGTLNFQGNFDPDNYHIDWNYKESDLLKPIEKLNIKISLECDKYLHIYVTDANQQRWENIGYGK